MFCKYCGEQNPDNAMFCKKCGGKLNEGTSGGNASTNESGNGGGFTSNIPEKPKKSFKIRPSIIAIVAVVLVVIFVGTRFVGGRSYEKTIDQFMTSLMESDGESLLKLLPDKVVEYGIEQSGAASREEFEEKMENTMGNLGESLDDAYGDDWSYKAEITETEDFTSDELKDLNEKYKSEISDIKIKDAKRLTVKISVKIQDADEQSDTMEIPVMKVGKSWYIDALDLGSLF